MKSMQSDSQSRDTGLAVILIVLLFSFFKNNVTLVLPAILLLLVTMIWPTFFKPLAPIWFGFSKILGTVVSKIFFALIFVLFAMPVGLFRKILGKDSMNLKLWKKDSSSVFQDRNHKFSSEDLTKPF